MIELRPAKYLLGRLAPMDNNDKIPQFNLGAGTYNSTVFLRGDGVWADPLAAGFVPTSRTLTINGVTYDLSANRTWTIDTTSATWGNITGTLSNQVDLQAALNAKQNNITLTTTGTSGAATLIGATLNIPQYSQDLSGYIPYVGATGNVNLGEYGLSAGWLRIDTSPTTYVAGTGGISWNSVDGTADLELLNGVTLQIGQELHFYAKATEVIPNGSAVMFAGVQGDHLLIAKASSAVLNANPNYFMGVATQDFVDNEFGYVTAFGNVRGLNTTTYSLGSVLYFDSTSATPGLLTATMPNANLAKIEVAAVVRVHANQGILMVRPHVMPMLNEIQDVNTNLSKTTPIDTDSVLLQDTADSNIWKKLSWLNTKATLKTYFDTLYQAIGNYVPTSRTITINSTTQDLSANRSWTIDKASVGLGNVDNTSDLNKPISTATQTALNAKQDNITLTTTGTSGAATLVGATLNIPQYQSVITNPITGTGTTNYVSKFTSPGSIGDSLIFDNGTNVGVGTSSFVYPASGRRVFAINGSTSSLLEFQNGGFINGYIYVSSTLYEQSSAYAPQTFLTSNSERMRITEGGNIGIGTSSPLEKLHVGGNILLPVSNSLFLVPSSTNYGIGTPNSDGVQIFTGAGDWIRFGHMSGVNTFTDRMAISASGNVGIGTTSPSSKLHLAGTTTLLTITDTTYSRTSQIGYVDNANLYFANDSSSHTYIGRYNNVFLAYGGGNVGIGTETPFRKLDVNGALRLQTGTIDFGNSVNNQIWVASDNMNFKLNGSEKAIITSAGNLGIGTTSPLSKLDISNKLYLNDSDGTYGSGYSVIGFNGLSNGANRIIGHNAGSDGLYLMSATSRGIYFRTNGGSTDNMMIDPSGNVGIATTSPDYTLDVNGYIGASRIYPYSTNNTYLTGDTGGVTVAGDGYLYVTATGGSYFANAVRFRSTIENDTGAYLQINGGTTGVTYFAGTIGVGSSAVYYGSSIQVGKGIFYAQDNGSDIGGKIYGFWDSGYQPYAGGLKLQVFRNETGSYAMYDAMTLSGSGNVGIGTTTPSQKLEISSTNSSILKLYNTEFNYGANQSKIDFFGKWYSGYPNNENLHASIVGEHGTGDGFRRGVLRFYTNNDGTMISPMMINYIGNVAIGTSAPHPSAILDLTSTTQGFLPPRMSDSEISSIASPRAGLIVWSTDSEVLNVFDGASWRRIAYA